MTKTIHWCALGALLLFTATSCANSEAETRSEELARQVHDRQVEEFVETFSAAVPGRAKAYAASQATQTTLHDRLPAVGTEADDGTLALVRELLIERNDVPAFVRDGRLTPDGQAVLRALRGAHEFGLVPADFSIDAINSHVATLESDEEWERHEAALALSTEDQAALLAFMMGHSGLDGTLPPADAVFGILAETHDDNPVPRVARAIDALSEHMSAHTAAAADLEVALSTGFIRYAIALRHGNIGYVPDEVAAANGWNVNDSSQHEQIALARAADAFREGLARGFAPVIAELPPPFAQHDLLVAAIAEYRGYVDAGGWESLSVDGSLRAGDQGDAVIALRRRLAAERYFSGALNDPVFDQELDAAVRHYQHTHQLAEDGVVSGVTLYSLNVSAERRLAQIHAALEFWRSTRRAHDHAGEHIWVNIPDFHAELWDGETLVHRWRVVVGRETGQVQASGEVRGRTPQFSDELQYVVFNPYWNVPDQIRREEYDPLIEADPYWLKFNGFQIVNEDGREWLRQLPGPDNALGRVKFLFPNEHDVYMHDTPSRSLFSRPTRSFSHGCVRVQDPLLLANILLRRDRQWSESRAERFIEEKLEMETEQWVSLLNPIPIHLEYVSVRVGDHGRVEFLADPYRLDRPRVEAWERRLGFSVPSEE